MVVEGWEEIFSLEVTFECGEDFQVLVGHMDGVLSTDAQWESDELSAWWWELDQGGSRHGQYG